jgi:hypothetical protein
VTFDCIYPLKISRFSFVRQIWDDEEISSLHNFILHSLYPVTASRRVRSDEDRSSVAVEVYRTRDENVDNVILPIVNPSALKLRRRNSAVTLAAEEILQHAVAIIFGNRIEAKFVIWSGKPLELMRESARAPTAVCTYDRMRSRKHAICNLTHSLDQLLRYATLKDHPQRSCPSVETVFTLDSDVS